MNAPTEPPEPSPRTKRKERRKTLHLGSLSHLTVSGSGGKSASVEDEDALTRERGGSGGRTTGGGGGGGGGGSVVLTSGPTSASRPGGPLSGSGPVGSGPVGSAKSAASVFSTAGTGESDSNAKDTSSNKRLSRKLRKAPAGSGVAEGELILQRLEGRILEEKEREREKEKRRNELQQHHQHQQQHTKEDDEQQQLQLAAVLSPKDLTRGGTLKRVMLAKAGGGSGVGVNLRDEMSGEKTTGSGICFNNNTSSSNSSTTGANNGGGVGEGDAAPLERRQLNPLVLESQEDASASSLQKALSCVHEEDASLLPPLPMERLHRKSLGGWMEQLTRRASATQRDVPEDEEELIEFEEAEIACLFWMQVELYRQACRFERDKAEKEARLSTSTTTTTAAAGSSSPAPPERRATAGSNSGGTAASEAGDANRGGGGGPALGAAHRRTYPSAPVHKISSLGWPIASSHGSYHTTPPQQPILSSHELRLRIFQQHVAEDAPLRIDLKSSTVKDIALEMDALSSSASSPLSSSSITTSTVTTSSVSLTAQSPLSSFSFSPIPSPLPSPTSASASASPFSADNLQAHPHPHAPDLLFREAQRQVFLQLRREAFPSFLQLFFSASLEAMDYPQPLPEVVFEEFRREYSKSEAPVSADAPDDHGWHFLEATKGVRCLRKFYPGKDIGCAKAVGVVGAPAAQVFRLVMACSETRQEWDELYLSGKVTENLASNIQLLYFSMRSLCKTVRKRDFVVARAFAVLRGKEGERGGAPRDTFVVISKSVPSAAHPPQKEFVRGEEVIEGWIIKETGNNSSLITRVVSIDFRGKIPPSVVNALNHRLAITSVLNIKAVFDKVREKTRELMDPDRDTYFPFVARVMYPHQYITREEAANEYSPSLTGGGSGIDDGSNPSASGASASGSGSGSSSSLLAVSPSKPARRGVKISEDVDESDGGHKRECSRATPRPAAEFPILSVMEGELVTVVKRVAGSKLWEGFHNRKRGLVNIDYIDPILPTLPSPSTNMIMNPGMVSLMEILLESDCRVVFTLLSVVDLAFNQSIPEAIIRIHEVGGAPTVLIKSAITLDLAKSTAVGTLFRGSEIHTSLLSSYAKTVAKKYLTKTLTSLIHNVCQLYDEGKSFEVDPARLKEGEVLTENADQLVTTTRSFLERILRTVDECPASLRDICRHLQREVSSKYPGTQYTVLGGLFFLRLLCPAIVSPTERSLIKGQVSPAVRRGLVMISKVLQNLANGIEFGCKEAHMAILNPFIIENLSVVHMFFDKLTDDTEVNKALKAEERVRDKQDVDADLPQESLNVMHAELSKHLDGIADKLEFEDTEAGMPLLERLLSVLTLLGPPSTEINKPATSALKGHLRRLSFGKGSFIKTFKQEREAQKEKEAAAPKSIIVTNPDKSEPVLLPTIEEIMEERIDVVGNEELDFSPEQRRRAKMKKDKLEKILGVALSPENLSAQIGGACVSTSAPPSARGDKSVLAVKERARSTTAAPAGSSPSGAADSKRRQSSTDRTTKRDADGARRSPRDDKGSAGGDQRQQRSKHHQYTATVPGASHKQKLVHKRLKLQKLLGSHSSSESVVGSSSNDPPASFGDDERSLDDESVLTTSSPSSPSSIRKKWWLGGGGSGAEATMEKEGNDPPSPPRSVEDGSAGRRRHKTAPERPNGSGGGGGGVGGGSGGGGGGGLNNFMRKWNTSDTAKERERKKSFIPWIGNNGTPPSGSDDEADSGGGGGGPTIEHQQQQQPAEAKQKRRKETFTGFFRRRLDSGGSSPETPVSAIARAAEDVAE